MRYFKLFIVAVLFFTANNSNAAIGFRSGTNLRSVSQLSDTSAQKLEKQSFFERAGLQRLHKVETARASKLSYRHPRKHVNSHSLYGIASILCSGLGVLVSCIALNGLFWGGTAVLMGPFLLGGICFAAGLVLAGLGMQHDRHRGFAILGLVPNLVGGVPWFCVLFPAIGVGGF